MPGELAGCCSVTMETSPPGLGAHPLTPSPLSCAAVPHLPTLFVCLPVLLSCTHPPRWLHVRAAICPGCHTPPKCNKTLTWKPTGKSCNVSVLDHFYFKYSERVGSCFFVLCSQVLRKRDCYNPGMFPLVRVRITSDSASYVYWKSLCCISTVIFSLS